MGSPTESVTLSGGRGPARRRVFVVGYLETGSVRAAVLFEREGLFGDSPPSREEGKVAPAVTTGLHSVAQEMSE